MTTDSTAVDRIFPGVAEAALNRAGGGINQRESGEF